MIFAIRVKISSPVVVCGAGLLIKKKDTSKVMICMCLLFQRKTAHIIYNIIGAGFY